MNGDPSFSTTANGQWVMSYEYVVKICREGNECLNDAHLFYVRITKIKGPNKPSQLNSQSEAMS